MKLLLGANDSHALKRAEFKLNTFSTDPSSQYAVEVDQKFENGEHVVQIVKTIDDTAVLVSDNAVQFLGSGAVFDSAERVVGVAYTQDNFFRFMESGKVDLFNPKTAEFDLLYTLSKDVDRVAVHRNWLLSVSKTQFFVYNLADEGKLIHTGTCPLDTVVCWCPANSSATEEESKELDASLVFGTKTGEVLVFDSSMAKSTLRVSKDAIKSVCAIDSTSIAVGDSRGLVQKVQISPLKVLGHFKGVQGSTRALAVYDKLLVTGGLDRYVRVFNVESRKLLAQVYIGDVIQCVAIASTDREERDVAENEMWDEIEHSSKKRRVQTALENKRKRVAEDDEKLSENSEEGEESGDESDEESDEESEYSELSFDDAEDDSFDGFSE